MIVVTSPNTNNYESWAEQMGAEQIIINCPDESDVRAMCIWKEHNGQVEEEEGEEADYWKKVNGRMDKVGPLLRCVFNDSEYKSRIDSCESKVKSMNLFDTYYYSVLGTNEVCVVIATSLTNFKGRTTTRRKQFRIAFEFTGIFLSRKFGDMQVGGVNGAE
ncbi:putative retrotransposon hot spot (RHS) protein [Trypanosoma cruzi]|uniref:Putative retrotransposon hot spot (RHS) protein n=1 Tax=Trypanosoma cruzi TaxID=5693 RepID=A0A2V2USF1_TRYCR|nr:putative retrotransposon hot spot (RHS) protein [Trypanosoma cruzi]